MELVPIAWRVAAYSTVLSTRQQLTIKSIQQLILAQQILFLPTCIILAGFLSQLAINLQFGHHVWCSLNYAKYQLDIN